MTYTITNNTQYNSLEVTFDSKPSASVLSSLKALKMRWNSKRTCWYGFASREQIEAAITGQTLEEQLKAKEATSKPAKVKEAKPVKRNHNVKVGDVFYTSWGYEQTNCEFYEVVGVRGSHVLIHRLASADAGGEAGAMSGRITPLPPATAIQTAQRELATGFSESPLF